MILVPIGALGTIIIGLGVYAGAAAIAVTIVAQVIMTIAKKARIAKLQARMPLGH